MKKLYTSTYISLLALLMTSNLFSQDLIVKSNLEGLTMKVGETFKPTSFAETLNGEKSFCQAVIYYNKKGVFSSAKAITVNRSEGTIKANEPGTHEIVALCIGQDGQRLSRTFPVAVDYPKAKEIKASLINEVLTNWNPTEIHQRMIDLKKDQLMQQEWAKNTDPDDKLRWNLDPLNDSSRLDQADR